MAGVLYQICVGCGHRTEKIIPSCGNHVLECPAGFDPYDKEKCPRHEDFMETGKRGRKSKKEVVNHGKD